MQNHMEMQKIKKVLALVLAVIWVFVLGISFAPIFSGIGLRNTKTALADENSEENNNKNELDKNNQKIEVKNSWDSQDATDKNKKENGEFYSDVSGDDIQELNKKISKLQSKISALAAIGIDIDSFNVDLEAIRSLVNEADGKLISDKNVAEKLIEQADKKLERLKKLIKMKLGGEEDDNFTEDIGDLNKKIAKIELRINAAKESGKDVSNIIKWLQKVKDLVADAQFKFNNGDADGADAILKIAEKKFEAMKDYLESVIGDDQEEDDFSEEHGSAVSQFVQNLKEISDLDGGIEKQVRLVAQAQNQSEEKLQESLNKIENRNKFIRFIIGPNFKNIEDVRAEIGDNEGRIRVLQELANTTQDSSVKLVLEEQARMLQQENIRLQQFILENEEGISLFGWLVRMFS